MSAKVTILGCGGSTGVPAIGNYWGKCDPAEPKNTRTRSSIFVETDNTKIVIDTGPDFRDQINREQIERVDAALYTHAHGDHINGMDELRVLRFRQKELMPIYASTQTTADLRQRFQYLFEGGNAEIYPPVLVPYEFQNGDTLTIGDLSIQTLTQDHGSCISTGFRIGDFGYSVDMLALDEPAIETFKGIKTWVVDATGYHQEGNPVHANLETVYTLNEQIGAEQVYLSSLTVSMDYQTLVDELPAFYAPCYDGLRLSITL